ncbi:MAG: hypothetical protein K2M99_08940, partial [Treponemataceae bacterium]|nr:hypothetical protein [Treponemataceae bacterium]
KKHSQRRSEKDKIALIVVAAIAAKNNLCHNEREMRERMVLPFSLQLEECFSIFIKTRLSTAIFASLQNRVFSNSKVETFFIAEN